MPTTDLGPLEPLLADETIWCITVNRYDSIYIGREVFRMEEVTDVFRDEAHLLSVIEKILAGTGHSLTASTPIVDVALQDGTHVHVIGRPIATHGTAMTLLKATSSHQLPTWEVLFTANSATPEIKEFLERCVDMRMNIAVCGSKYSGKTTLLNMLTLMIHPKHRLIVCEPAFDLHLPDYKNAVRLQTRPPNLEGKGAITMHHLVESARQMRPDRVIVSEVSGTEALSLLDTIGYMGTNGCLFALHAGSPREAIIQLEIMATSANPTLPLSAIRQKIARTLDLIVNIEILSDGWRRIMKISEVAGLVGDEVQLFDLFEFVQTGVDENGKILGTFNATGRMPAFLKRMEAWDTLAIRGYGTPGVPQE